MKYFVTIDDRELEVTVDGDRVTVDGTVVQAELSPVPGTPLKRLTIDGKTLQWPMDKASGGRWVVAPLGESWEVEVLDERARHIRQLTGSGQGKSRESVLKAPMPGLVVRVEVEPGQTVVEGQGILVLEAMKMENELRASAAGTVAAVLVVPGAAVEKGDVLVEYSPAETA
jgi:pyruvate carboxylase subunit B